MSYQTLPLELIIKVAEVCGNIKHLTGRLIGVASPTGQFTWPEPSWFRYIRETALCAIPMYYHQSQKRKGIHIPQFSCSLSKPYLRQKVHPRLFIRIINRLHCIVPRSSSYHPTASDSVLPLEIACRNANIMRTGFQDFPPSKSYSFLSLVALAW